MNAKVRKLSWIEVIITFLWEIDVQLLNGHFLMFHLNWSLTQQNIFLSSLHDSKFI